MPDEPEVDEGIRYMLRELFKADDEYGCGFYSDTRWLYVYESLRNEVGMQRKED